MTNETKENLIEKYNLESYVGEPVHDITTVFKEVPTKEFGIEKSTYDDLCNEIRNQIDKFFPMIDLSFLEMRHPSQKIIGTKHGENPMIIEIPQFAIYSLSSSKCNIGIHYDFYKRDEIHVYIQDPYDLTRNKELTANFITSSITKSIIPMDDKMIQKDVDYLEIDLYTDNGHYRPGIVTDFKSIIPQSTRKKIHLSNYVFDRTNSDHIYIISEVNRWNQPNKYVDPLVVALPNYEDNSKGYLIDIFDTTPIEDFVAREFTIKK
jgi:hypothetical protein